MSALRLFLWLLAFTGAVAVPGAGAAPPLTQIYDTLYKADGTPFTGSATISWRSFTAADSSNIPTNSVTVQIVGGQLRVKLVPTTNAAGSPYYIVRFNADGKTQFTELWSIPPSGIPVAVKDIRIPSPPGTNVTAPASVVQMVDVTGLVEALADRPTKSIGFVAGRAAFIDATGEIAAVSGAPGDCVKVDGTAGACGTGGTVNFGFTDLETPAGTPNGVNPTFTLNHIPLPAASLLLFRNGLLQQAGTDYLLSGNTVTFLTAALPQTGDRIVASYRMANP